jgi:hypothetical protein
MNHECKKLYSNLLELATNRSNAPLYFSSILNANKKCEIIEEAQKETQNMIGKDISIKLQSDQSLSDIERSRTIQEIRRHSFMFKSFYLRNLTWYDWIKYQWYHPRYIN